VPADPETDSGRELAQASADLVRARDRAALSLSALEREVTRAFEWRAWVRRKPGTALVLAFGLGFLLGRPRPSNP
jgi:hypothetical protein